MATAAGLALVLLRAPGAPHDDRLVRGASAPSIIRPVAEEIVRGGNPTIRWPIIEGATRYEVEITRADGQIAWETTTSESQATVPTAEALDLGDRYRVVVTPVPPHVAPEGALRTSFATGDLVAWSGYRLRRGDDGGRVLGGLGILGLIAAAIAAVVQRRRS
jgi:hypothetical protein